MSTSNTSNRMSREKLMDRQRDEFYFMIMERVDALAAKFQMS